MAKPVPVGTEQKVDVTGGDPSGQVFFLGIPEPTYVALSNVAAQRGMTLAQAISQALNDFCTKQSS